jgi:hypothetical protein
MKLSVTCSGRELDPPLHHRDGGCVAVCERQVDPINYAGQGAIDPFFSAVMVAKRMM